MHNAEQYQMSALVGELQPTVINRSVNVSNKRVKRGKFFCPVSRKFRMPWSANQSNWVAVRYLGV